MIPGAVHWPGDALPVRAYNAGSIAMKGVEPHPTCTVCGCDCTATRVEFFGFLGAMQVEMVMITTCWDHWQETLAVRLRAVERAADPS